MDAGDDLLRLLDTERIGRAPILLRQTEALERGSRVVAFWIVSVAEIEGTSKRADDIVPSLLAAVLLAINDSEERGVFDALETFFADLWSPNAVQYPPVALARRERHVVLRDPRLTVSKEVVEHLIARAPSLRLLDVRHVAIVWKLLGELERASLDPFLDSLQLDAGAAQVSLARRALDLGTIAHAFKLEVELDSIETFRAYAAA